MKKLPLKVRLILAVSSMSLLLVGVGFIGYRGLVDGEARSQAMYDHEVLALYHLHAVNAGYGTRMLYISGEVADGRIPWAEGRGWVQEAATKAARSWAAFGQTRMQPEEQRRYEDLRPRVAALEAALARMWPLYERQDAAGLRALVSGELRAIALPATADFLWLVDFQARAVAESNAEVERADALLKLELLIGIAVGLVLAVFLGIYLTRMAGDLARLIEQARAGGVQVNTSVTEIAATAKEQQATASEIAATTTEIGATAKEISATSRELVRTMGEVSAGAERSATLASNGQEGLGRMEETMRQVTEAAGSINAKLAALNEKAGNITQVVTTIAKVADQTNLLSLNAAIEAEKAGEHGRGFSVVATEIRRLADQTAVATYDIEQIVKEMQSAVSAGVMSMDKFSDEVRRGVDNVRQVGGQLSQIIQQVQTMTPRFEVVNEGVQAQATGAQQISDALGQLSEAVQQTVETQRQSTLAIDQLNDTAKSLRNGIEGIAI